MDSVSHGSIVGIFEQKIRTLAAALEHEDLEMREAARTTVRGFIDRIVIPPGDGLLQVVGNLGEMLTAAGATAVGNDGCGGSQPTLSAAVAPSGLMRQRATSSTCGTAMTSLPMPWSFAQAARASRQPYFRAISISTIASEPGSTEA